MRRKDYPKDLWNFIPDGWSLDNYAASTRMSLLDWYENLSFRANAPSARLVQVYCGDNVRTPFIYDYHRRCLQDKLYETVSVMGDFVCPGCHTIHEIRDERMLNCLRVDVNICAPDKIIMTQFEKWLKDIRKDYGLIKVKSFSDSDLDLWGKHRILQYLDIKNWCETESYTPTLFEYARILFPDMPNQEKIRKTTRQVADDCTSPITLERMGHQLAEEEWNKGLNEEEAGDVS